MAHNYFPVALDFTARAAGDSIGGFKCPVGMTLVGISLYPGALTGSPSSVNVDVRRNSTEVLTAVAGATAAGTAGEWLTSHFGGANAPVAFAAGEHVKIDLNFTAGTSPTMTGQVVLTFLAGTA